jgi:hypothetical protein
VAHVCSVRATVDTSIAASLALHGATLTTNIVEQSKQCPVCGSDEIKEHTLSNRLVVDEHAPKRLGYCCEKGHIFYLEGNPLEA